MREKKIIKNLEKENEQLKEDLDFSKDETSNAEKRLYSEQIETSYVRQENMQNINLCRHQKETIAAQRDTISALKEHIKSLKRNVPCFVDDGIDEIPIVFNDTSMKNGGAE